MTTLSQFPAFKTPGSSMGAPALQNVPDFVSTDAADLASHMSHCASTRSRFFRFQAALESAHALFLPRLVTAALLAAVLVGLVGMV